MGLCRAFYVGRLSCTDCGESAASGGAEGKEALPGQIMVFRWPDSFLPHGSEAMVSQGRPREDPHDLHVRGEGLRSRREERRAREPLRQRAGTSPCLFFGDAALFWSPPPASTKLLGLLAPLVQRWSAQLAPFCDLLGIFVCLGQAELNPCSIPAFS